jgi:hypothetical protein
MATKGDAPVATFKRGKQWPRWRGTSSNIVEIAERAQNLVRERTNHDPQLNVRLQLRGLDAEQYPSFEEFASTAFEGNRSLASIESIGIVIQDSAEDTFANTITFVRTPPAPAVELAVEGSDRVIVGGIEEELERTIQPGSPRIQRPNALVSFVVGSALGAALGFGFASIDWSFLPNNIVGSIVILGAWIIAYGALLLAVIRAPGWLFPQLELFREGERPRWDRYRIRVFAAFGAVSATILGFVLKEIFG